MAEEGPSSLLKPGSLLRDHWEVSKKIGGGGFGEVYKARDTTTGQACAIKVESCVSSKQVLKMEVAVLKRLQGTTPHVCEFLGCGRNEKVNYIIMTLLGPSLSELRKRQPQQRFSISTTLRIGEQIVSAVRAMHDCGFLHRDIKPSNFAIGGSTKASRVCYMLDFGLSRQYTTPTGEVRQPRPVAGFRGTVRYASLNAHLSKDLGRHDDLWSVLYMLVELASGQLPWRKIRDKEEAGKLKAQCDHKKLIRGLPTEFQDFLKHLQSLTYFVKPDYTLITNLLAKATKGIGAHDSDPFDWEQDYSAPSVTTASAGSPPAMRVEEKGDAPQEEAPANQRKAHPSDGSKTNCSETVDLNENCDREQLQVPPDAIFDNDKVLKQAHHSEKEPAPKSTKNSESETSTSLTTTTSSPSHRKHNEADKSLEKSLKPEVILLNGKVSSSKSSSRKSKPVNRYLTEDGEGSDRDSVPSHGHPQPFKPEQHVRVLPTYEHNISNQMHGESSFMRLKNASLANRNGLTDSLDRFFELKPKQSQEDAEEGDNRSGSEKSKEPKRNISENSPSDLKPSSLTREISSRANAGVVQIAPLFNPDNAPQLAYGSDNALSSGEHQTVELSLHAVPEQDQIMQQHALRACMSEDSSTSALSPLAPKVDIPQSCSLPEPSSKPSLTKVEPCVAKLLTPVSEQHMDGPVEKALPTLPSAHAHPVKSTRGNGTPLPEEAGTRKRNKPLTLELLPSPPLSELQIQLSTTIHSTPATPTVTNTSAPISNQRKRSLYAKFPENNITSDLPATADQKHNPIQTPPNHVPRPPTQPPPPNYTSCVSARRRRFSRTPTSGDHLPQKFTDQSLI